MADDAAARLAPDRLLARRRARLERLLERRLERPPDSGLAPGRRRFLYEEAEELYWNELAWEQLVVEEMEGGRELVEVAFAGFLSLIDGLLVESPAASDGRAPRPRPEVVEDVLRFLARRFTELLREVEPTAVRQRVMTLRLIDLVLYRLHGIPVTGHTGAGLIRSDYDD